MFTRLVLVLPLVLVLAGCASSTRMNGGFFGSSTPQAAASPAPTPAIAAPTTSVAAEPLAPLGPDGGPTVITSDVSTSPGADPNVIDPIAGPGAPVSTTVVADAVPPKAEGPNLRGLSGTWKISDAGRSTNCSMLLTQATLLDLFRAKPQGCQASSLAKVNAWQLRGQEVVLIEPGGRTAVRLFPKGDGSYEGAATTSGAVVTMSR